MPWVSFYESDDFQGGNVTYTTKTSVSNFKSVNLSNGKSANDEMDSLKLGPSSWLETYTDANYSGNKSSFEPNTIVRRLDDFVVGDRISSFKLYDAKPSGWQGPSQPKTKGNVAHLDLSADNVLTRFGSVVSGVVTLIPEVGGVISGIVKFLWPNLNNPEDVWNDVKAQAKALLQDLLDEQKAADMEKRLQGLGLLLTDYVTTSLGTPQKGQRFTQILGELDLDEPYFFDQTSPEKTLTYFVNLGTIEIAVLREQYEHYAEIYSTPGNPVSDPDQGTHLQILQARIKRYCDAANQARARAMEWRKSLVSIEVTGKSLTGTCYNVVDRYDGWHTAENNYDLGEVQSDHDKRVKIVENQYGAALDILLFPMRIWRYFDPKTPEHPKLTALYYAAGPFGGKTGTPFTDSPGDEAVTEILVRSGTRVDGIQLTYGETKGPLHGGSSGSPTSIALEPDETIIAAYGKYGDTVDQMFFRTSKGREVGGGGPGGVSWSSIAPGENPTLAHIAGIQGSSSLESITLYWVDYRTC